MITHAITVELPDPLYERIVRRATGAQRSIEDELATVVSEALSDASTGLPATLEEQLSQLQILADDDLWRAAELRVPAEEAERLEMLADKQATDGLSGAEHQELDRLVNMGHQVMLVRAEAAVLLKRRGLEISRLLQQSPSE